MASLAHLIAVLDAQVGYQEGYSGGHWNNIEKYANDPIVSELAWVQGQPWCAVFAVWGYRTAGVREGSFPVTASVADAMQWYQDNGRWSEYPTLGAQVILGGNVHTGIVVSFDNDWIYTIEGNTNTNGSAEGDGVYRRTRYRRDSFVTGYGRPDFDSAVGYAAFPGSDFFFNGQHSDLITRMGQRLVAVGCGAHYQVGPSPDWTEADRLNYADWQTRCGYSGADADGIPGLDSWNRLQVPAA